MIATFVIILGALLVLLWISSMYMWWRMSESIPAAPLDGLAFIHTYEKIMRLVRRGIYRALFYLEQVFRWTADKIGIVFFRIFPSARNAFKRRDELTGLKKGPSSYFLHSLSEEGPEDSPIRPRSKRSKKVV